MLQKLVLWRGSLQSVCGQRTRHLHSLHGVVAVHRVGEEAPRQVRVHGPRPTAARLRGLAHGATVQGARHSARLFVGFVGLPTPAL